MTKAMPKAQASAVLLALANEVMPSGWHGEQPALLPALKLEVGRDNPGSCMAIPETFPVPKVGVSFGLLGPENLGLDFHIQFRPGQQCPKKGRTKLL